jgi:effector-binding domain-containing protein
MSLLAAVKVIIISVFLLSVALWVKKKVKPRLYFLAGLIFVILAYFSLRLIHADGNKGTNLLILASDSLRNDRVKNKSLMPNVNRLVENGVLFNNSFTSLPRTFPAMISFLTGKYPVNHGVRHMFPDKDKRDHLDSSFMNELRKQGYSTSVISDFAGDVFSRMDIGFESVKAPYFNFITIIEQRSLEIHLFLLPYITNSLGRKAFPVLKEFANNGDPFLLADEIKYELKKLVKKDKFACFVFFSTAHFPYASPYPYYGKYAVKGYRGKYKYSKPPTVYKDESIGERDIEQINGLYNGSVNAIDTAMGSITEFLKKNKVYDNTVIIITADHGENLYENGWSTGHGEHLRGPHVLNVPLVVKFKDNEYKGTRVNALTRDIDVMPTLFEYLSLKPLQNSDGVSLMPLIKKEKSSPALTAFSETGVWFSDVVKAFYQDKRIMYPDITGISEIDFTYNMEVVIKDKYKELINIAKHRMIDNGKYRLIYMPTRNGIIYELYDVKAKDGYKTDISQKMPAIVKKMKSELFNYMKNDRSAMR